MALVRDFVGDDQMGLGIDNALNIIANMPAVLRAGRHGLDVGIGQGYLTVWRSVQGHLHRQKPFGLAPDAIIAASQMGCPFRAGRAGFLTIDPFGLLDIAPDLRLQMRKAVCALTLTEVAIPIVDRLEFVAVDRDRILLNTPNSAAKLNEPGASPADGSAVVAPEICDGPVVGHQSPRQPHQFHITPGFPLKPAAGWDPVQVTHR